MWIPKKAPKTVQKRLLSHFDRQSSTSTLCLFTDFIRYSHMSVDVLNFVNLTQLTLEGSNSSY